MSTVIGGRAQDGQPEGFGVYTVDDDRIQWSDHFFGWRAVDTG
jgi:hypothetical protein